MSFSIPALIAVLLLAAALFFLKKPLKPSYAFTHLADLDPAHISLRARLSKLPMGLTWLALALLLIAFSNPYLNELQPVPQEIYKEGIAIYLVLDHSGSMLENVQGETITKLDLLKKMTAQFIEERPNDMIGIVAFARSADPLTPLTLDHADVLQQLQKIAKVPDIQQEGTAIGYAIYKTVNLIEATRHFTKEKQGYDLKDSIIVLVTDGFQDPNPLDLGNKLRTMSMQDAAAYAKQEKVKVYIINVEPKMTSPPYAPYARVMQRVAEVTGGKLFLASDPKALQEVYQEINRLQKSPLNLPSGAYIRHYLYPALIACAMGLLCLALILDTTWLRRAP